MTVRTLPTSRSKKQLSYKELLQKHSPVNGMRDIYKVEISVLNLPK